MLTTAECEARYADARNTPTDDIYSCSIQRVIDVVPQAARADVDCTGRSIVRNVLET